MGFCFYIEIVAVVIYLLVIIYYRIIKRRIVIDNMVDNMVEMV